MSWDTSDRASRLPDDWEEIQAAVLRDAGYRCQLQWPGCHGTATDADHIIRGDNHARENLQAACGWCHARKSSKEGNARKAELRVLRKRPKPRHPGRRT